MQYSYSAVFLFLENVTSSNVSEYTFKHNIIHMNRIHIVSCVCVYVSI